MEKTRELKDLDILCSLGEKGAPDLKYVRAGVAYKLTALELWALDLGRRAKLYKD